MSCAVREKCRVSKFKKLSFFSFLDIEQHFFFLLFCRGFFGKKIASDVFERAIFLQIRIKKFNNNKLYRKAWQCLLV